MTFFVPGDPGTGAGPVLHVAVVACVDARLDLRSALGLELGGRHTVRDAGGVVTDDIRGSVFDVTTGRLRETLPAS
ncbi:hypothetical protein AMK10_12090 [Streptomyces sp. CB02058]|nr:hypothetical protein AMK10_12090 [Streptomyces sp. CB02058]